MITIKQLKVRLSILKALLVCYIFISFFLTEKFWKKSWISEVKYLQVRLAEVSRKTALLQATNGKINDIYSKTANCSQSVKLNFIIVPNFILFQQLYNL